MTKADTLILFDVDGTLTLPRKIIKKEMLDFLLEKLMPVCSVGLVGGSDLAKIAEQMGGMEVVNKFDYVFSENGLVARQKGVEIVVQSLQKYMDENKLQSFINFCLSYMCRLKLPCKRGTFIEFRNGLINVCPVGRSCSQSERDEFEQFDKIHKVRENFIAALEKEFPNIGLKYSIGGQISFDVFPIGWDKTYCLRFLNDFQQIHFFGDKTHLGGNDYEIFSHERTIGHTSLGPDDTKKQLTAIFNL